MAGLHGYYFHCRHHRLPDRGLNSTLPARDLEVTGSSYSKSFGCRRQSSADHGSRSFLRKVGLQTHHLG